MLKQLFHRVARRVSNAMGNPYAFIAAVALTIGWAVTGPLFGYSSGWQLFINTTTTIATFLVVFLIQNTQNHDSRAIHLKLDELLRAVKHARNALVDIEELPDEQLAKLEAEFRRLRTTSEARQTQSGRHGRHS
jgi:low affinity Fe/Cu permease